MTEKICFKCDRLLDLSRFYKHPRMADGHLNKCVDCSKTDVAKDRKNDKAKHSERDRLRQQKPYRRLKKLEYQRTSRLKNPEKHRARRLLGYAVRHGKIKKLPCEFCDDPKSEAHHYDYSKPYDVTWACFKCHREKFHDQEVIAVAQ